jgi:acetyl-CoA acetyltransferase
MRSMRGKIAIVGIGESKYFKRGESTDSEFVLTLKAILAACADAGVDPQDVDGFASYSDDRNDPSRLAAALGCKELTFSNMQWGGGGGGAAAAVANAAAAIAAGLADCVVAYRGLAQGQFGRFGQGARIPAISGPMAYTIPYGLMSPAQMFAMKVVRFMHEHGVHQQALRAISLAAYQHAQNNPRAVMYGKPLTAEKYDNSRWIVEPFHLYDCCLENDGAAAILMVSAERAQDFPHKSVYVLGAAEGSQSRAGAAAHNTPDYASSGFKSLAPRLYGMAQVKPADVDVLQSYENFTGGVLMSIVEHGFCKPEEVNEFFTLENFSAPGGRLPLNTSGGNLAECYMHGLGLTIEAIRQVRGQSCNQVPGVDVSMMIAGPMVTPVSSVIFGSEATR